jgi:hypothetical protein
MVVMTIALAELAACVALVVWDRAIYRGINLVVFCSF